MSDRKVPVSVTDFLMHVKADENCEDDMERVLLPITRYGNILNSPSIVTDVNSAPGAPFVFLKTKERELDLEEIRNLCGDII